MSIFALASLVALISCASSHPVENYSSSSVAFSSQSSSYDAQMESIVNDLANCMDHKLKPIMSKLAEADEEQMRELSLAGLSSYVQHLFDLVKEENEQDHNE